jgi:N4-gp56 family major capsid protein
MDPAYYGAWIRFTRELDIENFDPIVDEMAKILGEQAGLSVDTLVRNDIVDNATVAYAGSAAARSDIDVSDELLTFADFVNQVAELQAQDARPINGVFPVFMHPYSIAQLFKDTSFFTIFTRESNASGNLADWASGKVGTIFGCEIYATSNARHYTSDVEVYTATFIGAESYGLVGVGALPVNFGAIDNAAPGFQSRTGMMTKPVNIIMNPLGSQGDDPLHQRGSLAWVTAHDQTILNSSWIIRLEHAVEQSA